MNGELSEGEKVQARYSLILEQTAAAQGDFARTSDGIANRQRTLAAEFENAQAAIGEALLPAYEAILDVVPQVIEAIEDLAPTIATTANAIAEASPSIVGFVESIINTIGRLPAAFGILGAVGDLLGGTDGIADFGKDSKDGIEDFTNQVGGAAEALDKLAVESARLDLITSIQAGVRPAEALNAAFLQLLGPTERFESAFESFVGTAGLSGPELENYVVNLLGAIPVTEEFASDIDFLNDALFRLPDSFDDAETDRFQRRLSEAADAVQNLGNESLDVVDPLREVRVIADELGVSLNELAQSDAPEVVELLESVPPATLEWALAAERVEAFADSVSENLADSINVFAEVPDAIRGFGKKSSQALSKEDFLKNLETTAQEQAAFEQNLAQLFRVSPLLAQTLQTEGVAARDLVDGFLEDSFSAERAEALLAGEAQDVIGTFSTGLLEAVATGDLDAAGAEAFSEFISGFSSPQLLAELDALLRAIELSESLNIPVNFVVPGGGIPIRTDSAGNLIVPTADRAENTITGGNPGVTVNIDASGTTTNDLESALATGAQQTAAAAALLAAGGQ